jgi:hypothetical protein
METSKYSKEELILSWIIVAPLLIAIPLLILGLFSLVDNSLLPPFNPNLSVVIIVSIAHLIVIIAFSIWKKVEIGKTLNKKNKLLGLIFLPILIFLLSFLLTMGGKMNLNNWLKSNLTEQILITVKNKSISKGRGTDYYIDFETPTGEMNHRVVKKNYSKFVIGESFNVTVQKGYFEGYFLTKKIK